MNLFRQGDLITAFLSISFLKFCLGVGVEGKSVKVTSLSGYLFHESSQGIYVSEL